MYELDTDRREFVGAVATAIVTVTGCTKIKDTLGGRKARVQTSYGGASQHRYINGQPTFESAPAADGWLVTDSDWIDDNIRWDQLEGENLSLRRIQGNLDSETFLTVFVGALPNGYALSDYRDAHIEDQTIHVYAETSKTSDLTPSAPEYTYDYSFILWRLLNNTQQPTEMDFNFRLGELSTDSPGRPSE